MAKINTERFKPKKEIIEQEKILEQEKVVNPIDSLNETLKCFTDSISKSQTSTYSQILELIKQNQDILKKITKDTPINVEVVSNNKDLTPAITGISENLKNLIKVVNEKPTKFECDIQRKEGIISKIIIKGIK